MPFFHCLDGHFHRFQLAKERPDAGEGMVPPVLQQALSDRGDVPVCGVAEGSPGVYLLPHLVDDGVGIVLLFFLPRLPQVEFALSGVALLLLGLGYWGNELRLPPPLDDALGGHAPFIQFPVPGGMGIGAVEDGGFEEEVIHGSGLSPAAR